MEDFSRRIGMDPGFAQVDGSGLSRMNVIAPTHLVQLLRGMEEHPEKARFDELLSAAGIPHPAGDQGTDQGRAACGSPGRDGRLAGMAGTVVTREGERMAVAVLVNGVNDLPPHGGCWIGSGLSWRLIPSSRIRGKVRRRRLPPFRSAGSDPGRGAVTGE